MKEKIKLLAMDVDGTMTDGRIYIGDNGELFKAFNVKDGMGIKIAHDNGIITAIVTGRYSEIVNNRAAELNVDAVYQNVSDKAEILEILRKKYNLKMSEIAYIGDDVNDMPAFKVAGLSFAPSDAISKIKEVCDVSLSSAGGLGAIRECVEYIVNYNKEIKNGQ